VPLRLVRLPFKRSNDGVGKKNTTILSTTMMMMTITMTATAITITIMILLLLYWKSQNTTMMININSINNNSINNSSSMNNSSNNKSSTTNSQMILVCTVIEDLPIFRCAVMNVNHIFVKPVIGVTNFKLIMKSECAIDAMPFIVERAMKWISAMIVEKLSVRLVRLC
jgi:hypothetical protein